jgi:hypothetical protein
MVAGRPPDENGGLLVVDRLGGAHHDYRLRVGRMGDGGGTARSMAQTIADEAVLKRLAPMCVVQFKQAPGKDQKLEELGKTDSWKRSEYVEKQGWATMPGEEKPRKVAEECARLLMLIGK